MNQKLNLKAAFVIGLLTLIVLCTDASAQRRRQQAVADLGVVKLALNQKLRVTVYPKLDGEGINIRMRRCLYTEQGGGAIMLDSSQTTSIIPLAGNQGMAWEILGTDTNLRVRIASNSPNMVVTFSIYDGDADIVFHEVGHITMEEIWDLP